MRDNTTLRFEVVQSNGTASRVCPVEITAVNSYLFNIARGFIYQNSTYVTYSCGGGRTSKKVRIKFVNGTVYILRGGKWLNTGSSSMGVMMRYNPVSLSLKLLNTSECSLKGNVMSCNVEGSVLRSMVSYYLGLPGNMKVLHMTGNLTMRLKGGNLLGSLNYSFDVVYGLGSGVKVRQKGEGKEIFMITPR